MACLCFIYIIFIFVHVSVDVIVVCSVVAFLFGFVPFTIYVSVFVHVSFGRFFCSCFRFVLFLFGFA